MKNKIGDMKNEIKDEVKSSSRAAVLERARILESTARQIRIDGGAESVAMEVEREAKRLRQVAKNWTDELEKLEKKYGQRSNLER